MAIPWNIRGSASQLFYQDKQSLQYKALLAITDVPHPERSILGAFIIHAEDPEEAARYFLRMTSGRDSQPPESVSQFLSRWKLVIGRFRPTQVTSSLSAKARMLIYGRDGGRCCLTHAAFKSHLDGDLRYVQMVPALLFLDPRNSEESALSGMLEVYLSTKSLENYRSTCPSMGSQEFERLDNIWLLSAQAFDAVKGGGVYFKGQNYSTHPDKTRRQTEGYKYFSSSRLVLENRTPELTPTLNEKWLEIHARFSKSLAWMEVQKHIDTSACTWTKTPGHSHRPTLPSHGGSKTPLYFPTLLPFFKWLLLSLPSPIRASIYDGLAWLGSRIYGPSLSMTVHNLPFGLYLRRGSLALAPKYHAEAHTLRMIEQKTSISAPRAIDVLETSRFWYFLMTSVPGRPIGQQLEPMTDGQLKQVVADLKGYIAELRAIPNDTATGFQICNSQGGGILDYRIPDSQREELQFKTEADFNKHLTDPFSYQIGNRAAVSHDISHDIVFTHSDLNPRNILGENGMITGIVDWKNAGFFPEYWEYTKTHYTVRGLI
ncbi:hypothetical protein AJ79_08367 [Helicocarpus griseus UAMH5409]|uniref:Aminoglycoside phosphotransferase domain-containing protein n=1 Tax=Helicocarpus griseus UAMH5409 TaxID=1447875 RepID=A0A2B7WTY6_9EURO|nr:hypothetical protein AJ79_08367 [Helicocarpus griseus UAMH5409]